jgi:hypothetical protein
MTARLGTKLLEALMSKPDKIKLHQQIETKVKAAVAQALERHRRLGEPVAIWQEGKVVVLSAEEIPQTPQDNQSEGESHA